MPSKPKPCVECSGGMVIGYHAVRCSRCHRKRTAERNRAAARKAILRCQICGTEKLLSPSIVRNRRTCSWSCRSELNRRNQIGELSHRWKGGRTSAVTLLRNSLPYRRWRTTVFERDDFRCQMCKQRGGRLTAHHIREFSTHWHLVLMISNGITLCWPCHRSIRQREKQFEARFLAVTTARAVR